MHRGITAAFARSDCRGDDWGFAPRFDLAAMTANMLVRLSVKLSVAKAD
jgi:hypothetical protein